MITVVSLFAAVLFYSETTQSYTIIRRENLMIDRMAKVNPKLSYDQRNRIVDAIMIASHKHGVSSQRLFAILAHESRFKIDAINEVTKDYGIGQINEQNIVRMHLDKNRLLTDVEYSVDTAAKILKHFKQYERVDALYWTRYNSSKMLVRLKYAKLVDNYL